MDISSQECCVCYQKNNILNFPCEHAVCIICINQLYKSTCPMCNKEISVYLEESVLLSIKNREIIRKVEIEEEELNDALKQIIEEENNDIDANYDRYEDEFNHNIYYTSKNIVDEYLRYDLSSELFLEIAMEESLFKIENN